MKPESTWTTPRPDCPHPEWWHATDDQSAELEIAELIYGFVRAIQPEVVIETGTAYASTAVRIAEALTINGHGHLHTLEPDPDRHKFAQQRLAPYGCAVVVQARSLEWTPPDGIGFAWLDSDQTIRTQEVEWLRPHTADGAVFGIHDTGPHHTVQQHLPDLTNVTYLHLRTPRGVVFGQWT